MYIAVILILLLGIYLFFPSAPQSTLKYYQIVDLFEQDRVRYYALDFGTGELSMYIEVPEGETIAGITDNPNNAKPIEEKKENQNDIMNLFNLFGGNQDTVLSKLEHKDPLYLVNYKIPSLSVFLDDVEGYVNQHNRLHSDYKITYDYIQATDNSWWINLIPTLILLGALVVMWVLMMRQTSGGGKIANFGKAKVKQPLDEKRRKTFADVAGADEEKEELAEIVQFLKNPHKFNELGARIPKGVLLVGPPGTGKTLLAKAVAGEANVPFFSISGSDFVEMYVGVGASRVRDLFEQAKKNAPAIIFIDEIDAVGRHRGAGLGGGHDEREQTLNQLLVEMDGFGANEGVIIIAATNRRDILDPALLRPGRFDRQVVVGYPDIRGREQILRVHARNKPLGPDVLLSDIAKSTVGFTGADLENLLNEAALLAARRGHRAITQPDIEEATIKVVAGPEKRSHKVTEKDKKLTAFHEAGHALCTYYCETQDPVHQISIIPRGMAGGYTMSLPSEDRSYMSKMQMYEEIVVLLGGRVAEKLVLDDISTGASNDIERATGIARSMVTKYGFSEKLGPIVYGENEQEVFLGRDFNHQRNYSENVAAEIDQEIREIIDTCYEKTKDILTDHMDQLRRVAEYLFEEEKMDGEEFKLLMEGKEIVKDHKKIELDKAETDGKEKEDAEKPSSDDNE
ncbi:ATP-dependent zinc metalloprotease FtsH [Candidatus Soleaferrea massiliensis]|uniref:ATP-dependent zinc metalloprotease FtsH n=1 Tax=Candidatus Soleaferrea massiliensis TaxID=1470354 RepID=UPI00058F3514|nr:ATP-dependent zinc metalloprotease FtsH [Candidatus Soleaferrea massiliensis]